MCMPITCASQMQVGLPTCLSPCTMLYFVPATQILLSKRCPEQGLQHVYGIATADYVSFHNPLLVPKSLLLLAEPCQLFDMDGGKHDTLLSHDHPDHQHQTLLRIPLQLQASQPAHRLVQLDLLYPAPGSPKSHLQFAWLLRFCPVLPPTVCRRFGS